MHMTMTRQTPLRRDFGRRIVVREQVAAVAQPALTDELKLFATTFIGGFLFMAVYLG